jgi:deoxyribodipyrimidine photo-lyase
VRQLCWRDFFHQVLAARPESAQRDLRGGGRRWNDDDRAFESWCEARTGFPVVDAAMRQLTTEGFMHNRARMIVASFLTKDLYIDWRLGAAHFMSLLVDGDVANNQLNWQWVAGTGTDTNPNRVFNPVVQSRRFDRPASTYDATSRSWPSSTPARSTGPTWPPAAVWGTPRRSSITGRRSRNTGCASSRTQGESGWYSSSVTC